jgi:hypothetical protein
MKKRTCVKCKKSFAEKDGVLVLRGISFVCNSCYKKEKVKQKDAEVCEFC